MQEFTEFSGGFGYADLDPAAAAMLSPQPSPQPDVAYSELEHIADELGFDTVSDMEAAAKSTGQSIWEDAGCLLYRR